MTHEQLKQVWGEVRQALRRDLGARAYDQWLKPAALLGYCEEDGVVRLALPSAFTASWVNTHYSERLELTWKHFLPTLSGVRVEIANKIGVYSTEALPKDAFNSGNDAKSDLQTKAKDSLENKAAFIANPNLCFENYRTGPTNTIATNAAKAIADGGPLRFNPLYIQSATGQGKTHLLHAIAHGYQARKPNAHVLYMSAERFMVDFVTAMRAKETMAFKQRLRSVNLLLIDDVQFIAGKDATQEEFLHTVDSLMSSGRRLVISADRPPQALNGVEGRILSRLTQGLVVDIQPADYALRYAILSHRLEESRNVHVPSDVLDLLASRIASNLRELLGGFNRLTAYASLSGRAINRDFAEEILEEMFRANQRRVTIEEIQRRVADHYKIRQAEMFSARRSRVVARPRQVAMYLAKQLTPRSLPEIGRRFGGRDHTTVIYAVRQIEKLRGEDRDLDQDVRHLMHSLEGYMS